MNILQFKTNQTTTRLKKITNNHNDALIWSMEKMEQNFPRGETQTILFVWQYFPAISTLTLLQILIFKHKENSFKN